MFENSTVQAASIVDFLDRYYKPRRFRGRGEKYAAALITSHQRRLNAHGHDIISHHDSVTGRVVAYFGTPQTPVP